MRKPVSYRKDIPFFCNKSERDFRRDVYERYDTMVTRQSALHLADEVWGMYPMQRVFDFAHDYYPDSSIHNILEIGCGVGRWIASLAQMYPQTDCWGLDYSYQMLRQANEFWVLGKEISLDLSRKGFPRALYLQGHQLANVKLGLAKATDLPFSDSSQDLIVSRFLFDRLDSPDECLDEIYRILRPNGRLILVTPLNFDQATLWERFYPPIKIHEILLQKGFSLLEWN